MTRKSKKTIEQEEAKVVINPTTEEFETQVIKEEILEDGEKEMAPETPEEAEKILISADNIDKIEQELKEEYGEDAIKAPEIKPIEEIDFSDIDKMTEDFAEIEKKLNTFATGDNGNISIDGLKSELEELKTKECELVKRINAIQRSEERKEHHQTNSRITSMWCGTYYI